MNASSIDIYGYKMGNSVELRCSPPLLFNSLTGKTIRIRSTKFILLEYLITHAYMTKISDNDIMVDVFESRGLKCSGPRLWQAINSLNEFVEQIGKIPKLISRVDSNGYAILSVSITVLYVLLENAENIKK